MLITLFYEVSVVLFTILLIEILKKSSGLLENYVKEKLTILNQRKFAFLYWLLHKALKANAQMMHKNNILKAIVFHL